MASALAALAPVAAVVPRAAAQDAPRFEFSHHTSNWSGYAVTGQGPYTSASADWTQPAANCQQTRSGQSAFWVGLDGDTTSTVEQTGTSADCSNGSPVYYGWYEMYPSPPVFFSDPVAPGDRISASVTYQDNGNFRLVLDDATRGWTQDVTSTSSQATRGSAEIVAEAPATAQGVVPLADFQSVGFTGATVNGAPLTRSTTGENRITMSAGGTVKARPGSLSSNGSFTVTWHHQ
jgi:hypothetical protein